MTSLLHAGDVVFQNNRTQATLIELYSSEGCSSCPPAEAWLNGLKTAPGLWRDLFPVAFHVDYWDGLGWPDRFARGEYTQRQRDYATRLGQDSVYTPEFVANGLEWRRGWFSNRLPEQATEKMGALSVTAPDKEGNVSARYTPTGAAPEGLTINVALLGFDINSDVRAGENSGRRLEHDFVVLGFRTTALTPAGDGVTRVAAPLVVQSQVAGEKPGALVAWVSDGDGKILQIAGGWLPKP